MDSQPHLRISGHHSQKRRDPHPENSSRTTCFQSRCHSHDISCSNGSCQCRTCRLKTRIPVSLSDCLTPPDLPSKYLKALRFSCIQYPCSQHQYQQSWSPHQPVNSLQQLSSYLHDLQRSSCFHPASANPSFLFSTFYSLPSHFFHFFNFFKLFVSYLVFLHPLCYTGINDGRQESCLFRNRHTQR